MEFWIPLDFEKRMPKFRSKIGPYFPHWCTLRQLTEASLRFACLSKFSLYLKDKKWPNSVSCLKILGCWYACISKHYSISKTRPGVLAKPGINIVSHTLLETCFGSLRFLVITIEKEKDS